MTSSFITPADHRDLASILNRIDAVCAASCQLVRKSDRAYRSAATLAKVCMTTRSALEGMLAVDHPEVDHTEVYYAVPSLNILSTHQALATELSTIRCAWLSIGIKTRSQINLSSLPAKRIGRVSELIDRLRCTLENAMFRTYPAASTRIYYPAI
jgi:hypothetical protein